MSKFGDIGSKSRRHIDPTALQQVVNGGQVAIKKTAAQEKTKKIPPPGHVRPRNQKQH